MLGSEFASGVRGSQLAACGERPTSTPERRRLCVQKQSCVHAGVLFATAVSEMQCPQVFAIK